MNKLFEKPDLVLALVCLAQALLWTAIPTLVHSAPPLDVVEMALWGREWVWATYKHPAFPAWAMEIGRIVTGSAHWPAYLFSQTAVVVTYVAVYRLGIGIFGPDRDGRRQALAAVLLTTALYYVSLPTPEWNHNVPQLAFYALVILSLWRATAGGGGIAAWIALGLVGGIGMHVKYSFGVLLAVAALWIVLHKRGAHLKTAGPWLGLVVFLVVIAPQIVWLVDNDFLPLEYARSRAAGVSVSGPLVFLGAQLLAHAGMVVLALVAGLFVFRLPSRRNADRPTGTGFLMLLGLGPSLLMAGLGLFAGFGLKTMWGLPMFTLSGLIIVALTRHRLTVDALRRLAVGAAILIVALPLGHGLYVGLGGRVLEKPLRVQWPQKEIAATLQAAWASATAAPLKIVAGHEWTAGLVALNAPDLPSIMTYGSTELAPWVTSERIAREGVLVVWQDHGNVAPAWAVALAGDRPFTPVSFAWPGFPRRPELRLRYAVVPPVEGDGR